MWSSESGDGRSTDDNDVDSMCENVIFFIYCLDKRVNICSLI